MQEFALSTLDITVMIVYILLVVVYGLYYAKRQSSEDYFLAGRSMTWPIIGISLFAANVSSSTLVGLAGDAYSTNTAVYNYEWLAAVVLVFFAIFFLPFYLKSKVFTMPEFLERRYDSRSRYYFSFITLVGNVLIDTAAGLYVGMLIFKLIFPEMETWQIIVFLAFASAIYTVPGGLSSVIHTEVVQAILLILGSIVLTYFAFEQVGWWSGLSEGIAAMKDQKPVNGQNLEEILSLVKPIDDPHMPWTGLLLGAPILGFYFWANNQFMVQRTLGAKNLNHGRWGAIFAGFLKLPVLFFMVFPGTVAIVLYSDLDLSFLNYTIQANGEDGLCKSLNDCPNMTYPVLLFKLLPSGLLGLVLAGLLAAMMSSVSATFNSASTLFTMDFVKTLRPNTSSKDLVRIGQFTTLLLVILASAWAPQIEKYRSVWSYLQTILAYICPPVVAVFVLGLFWKRTGGTAAFITLLSGLAMSVFLLLIPADSQGILGDIGNSHFLHRAFALFIICLVIQFVVSLFTEPANKDQVKNYVWRKELYTEETAELAELPWYKNFRIWSVFLIILTSIIVIAYW